MTLREELIQAAAVAVAIVQDLDYGSTVMALGDKNTVFNDVLDERYHQEEKWGPRHHTPSEWMAILVEEVGEAASELDAADEPRDELNNLIDQVSDVGMRAQWLLKHVLFPAEEAAAARAES